jgi:NTE family protein
LHALWKNSLYNSQPLIDLIHREVSLKKIRTSGKKVAVGAVSLTTGEYRVFTQDDDSFVDGVLGSSSFPGALKPISIDNQLWTDGGLKHITPLASAISLGADEVDMIICSPTATTDAYKADSKTISLALRSVDLMSDQIIVDDLTIANQYNKLVKCGCVTDKRFVDIKVVRPEKNLTENSLDFDPKLLSKMMDTGYQDAKKQYK